MRPMAKTVTAVLAAFSAAAFAACQPFGSGTGELGMRVQFPQGFTAQAIPDGTTSIKVTVTGEGLEAPATATLSRQRPNLVISVPSGPKTVQALAFDAQNRQVAQGSTTISVVARTKVTAVVTLSADPLPSPSVTPSEPAAGPSAPPGTSPPPPPPPTPGPTPPPVQPTANILPGGGAGGGTLATPTPTPTPNASSVAGGITVNDGGAAPAPGSEDL